MEEGKDWQQEIDSLLYEYKYPTYFHFGRHQIVPACILDHIKFEYPEGAVDAYINGTSTQIDYTDPIKAELSTPAVNKLSVKWDESASNEEKLERIITQKWLALFPLSTEGWAEQRRTGYPRFFPAFVNESNGAVNTEEGVRRVIYSSQAYDANAKGVEGGIKLLDQENSSKFGISGDKGGTHLWWDNADKGNF